MLVQILLDVNLHLVVTHNGNGGLECREAGALNESLQIFWAMY